MLVVEKKKPAMNLTVPRDVQEAIEQLRIEAGLNERQKWIVVNAAFVMLLGASEDERNYYFAQVAAGGFGGTPFAKLIARARAGDFRKACEAFRKVKDKKDATASQVKDAIARKGKGA